MNVNDRVASVCNTGTVTKVYHDGSVEIHWDGFGGSTGAIPPAVAAEYFRIVSPAPAQSQEASAT